MTLPEQIEVLKKVYELSPSRASLVFLSRSSDDESELEIYRTITGKNIQRTIINKKRRSVIIFEDFATCIRILDKMIEQFKEMKQ